MRAIVVGLGIMGASAAHHLCARGWQVVAFDGNKRGHTLGASHGQSRITRQAYYEAPQYVPLLKRAYELWFELQSESSQSLVDLHGGLFIGAQDSELVAGSRRSAIEHAIDHEYLDAAALMRRWPHWRLPESFYGVYEPGAGTLFAERCLAAELDLASKLGAQLHFEEPVLEWAETKSGITVRTGRDTFEADKLVIAAGPWAAGVLHDLNLPLYVRRVVACHFEPLVPEKLQPHTFPVYCIDTGSEFFYGFPCLPDQGMKVGRHDTGAHVDPDKVDRQIHPQEIEERRHFLERFIPDAAGRFMFGVTCLYGMSPDCHFVIDVHPKHRNVVLACGFSGHGFKFGTVVGEILADLVSDGATRHPVDFLSLSRLSGAAP